MKKFLIVLCLLAFATPCFAGKNDEIITPQTQLQKRQYQTREYSNISKPALMKAILNVLQDEGYIVNNASSLLGFISGAKEFSTNDKTINFEEEFGTKKMFGATVAVVEATANISEYGKSYRVRINFKRKFLNQYGNAQKIEEVTDEKYYQGFFARTDKAIFIQRQKI